MLTLYLNGICSSLCIKFNLHNPVRLSIFLKNNSSKHLYWKPCILLNEKVITNLLYTNTFMFMNSVMSKFLQWIIVSFWRQDWYIFGGIEGGKLLRTFRLGIFKIAKLNGLV